MPRSSLIRKINSLEDKNNILQLKRYLTVTLTNIKFFSLISLNCLSNGNEIVYNLIIRYMERSVCSPIEYGVSSK